MDGRRLAFAAGIVVISVSAGPAAAGAEDWPQFRGPTGQGHSTEPQVPLEWSEGRNVRWKTPVQGTGWSSPVVAGGRVWMTTAIEEGPGAGRNTGSTGAQARGDVSLRALAFDVETGREIVNVEVFRIRPGTFINVKNSRASPTPVVDGGRVYVHYGAEGTAALTAQGEILWTARFPYDSQHGAGGSPVIYRDLLVFSCDGPDTAFVVAVDTDTGAVRWKTPRRAPWDQAYSTPLLIEAAGPDRRDQLVSAGAHHAAAYDPATGREIWRVSYPGGFSNVPRPVYANGIVYIATGFNEPSILAVRVDGQGDVTRTHVVWTLRRGAPLTPSPLVTGNLLYFVSDIGIATCVDAATGKPHWQQRIGGNYSASPVLAAGRVYFLSEEGITTVIAVGSAFRKLATSELDGSALASMAVSAGSVFIRTGTHLYRIHAG